ncbi:MAG: hypothetical protein JWQ34_1143 [Mucilaginibacter sp.]|uniref:hypothetical protein n=1 Tax=Mucilaginibacter sp. TaxID=1882438 RepID=UPI00261506FF|nr:hypothetical protein [Mucilaginibacter sp.]MDB5002918.1 hypothetical protein [Mucilaginibacter sp.]
MKRIYYLLSFIVAVVSFTACNPLDKTYKDIDALPTPANNTLKGPAPLALNITLTAADYGFLTDYAKTALSFKTLDDAKADVPIVLGKKYPTAVDKSSVVVTYGITPTSITLADSLNATTAITLQTTPTNDYVFPAYNGAAGNTFSDLSATAVINWLKYKYQVPLPENSIRVLTYLYFESGKTAGSGTLTTDAFLYANGAWTKIYRVSTAQYTTTGNGLNSWFVANDAANIPSYLNAYLKADVAVMATAKYGDIKYVNYRYLTTYQKVMILTFDGNNWVTTPILSSPLTFTKTNGIWIADNTVNYTLLSADYKYMGNNTTAGSVAGRANIVSFPDFNVSATTDATYWSDTDIQGAIITFLQHTYTTAVADQKFVITYLQYFKGVTSNVTKTFKYDGTAFVYVP